MAEGMGAAEIKAVVEGNKLLVLFCSVLERNRDKDLDTDG